MIVGNSNSTGISDSAQPNNEFNIQIAGDASCSEHLNSSQEGSAASRGSCGRTLSQSSHDVCRTNGSGAIPTIPRSVRRSLRVCLRSRDSALRGPHVFLPHQAAGMFRIVPFGLRSGKRLWCFCFNTGRWMLTFAEFMLRLCDQSFKPKQYKVSPAATTMYCLPSSW
jgi:hypothetical protein